MKFNTSKLLTMVDNYCIENRINQTIFVTQVADAVGLRPQTVYNGLHGYNYCSKNMCAAMAQVMDVDVKVIERLVSNKKSKKAGSKKSGNKKSGQVCFDYDLFMSLIEKSEYSKASLCKAVNISTNTPLNWRNKFSWSSFTKATIPQICYLLKCKEADLVKTPEEMEALKKEVPSSEIPAGYQTIKDIPVGQVSKIFEVFNENLLQLAKDVQALKLEKDQDSEKIKQIDEKIDSFMKLFEPVKKEEKHEDDSIEDATGELPEFTVELKEIPNVIAPFDPADSFTDYKFKVNHMAHLLALADGLTHKQELSKLYKDMTKVYGVVYDQMSHDFLAAHGRKPNGSMELLYENELWREIFYATTMDKVTKACDVKVRTE